MSKNQSSQWQRLADVPEEQFEAALADPDTKPSTAAIIAAAVPPKPEVSPRLAEGAVPIEKPRPVGAERGWYAYQRS